MIVNCLGRFPWSSCHLCLWSDLF